MAPFSHQGMQMSWFHVSEHDSPQDGDLVLVRLDTSELLESCTLRPCAQKSTCWLMLGCHGSLWCPFFRSKHTLCVNMSDVFRKQCCHTHTHTHTLTHVTFSENEMSVLNYSSGVSDNSPESDESKRWGIMHEGACDFHLVCLRLFPDAVFWPITLPLKSLRPAWVVSKPIFWNNTRFSLLYLPQREN